MAKFLANALKLPAPTRDYFVDDNGHLFESDINRIADAGITMGCNPPGNTFFCPNDDTTRGAMAAMLTRAFGYPSPPGNTFTDDDGHIFESDIEAIAAAGISKGCDPPANTEFCPNSPVTRDTMATFIARALGLKPISPPAPAANTPTPSSKPSPVPPAPEADSIITGASCPCTVSGASELIGNVNLDGDLVVDGGVLIARPGVNLEGNGFQILFRNGARADFQGTEVFTWSGNGSNANVSRDITFDNVRRIIFDGQVGVSTLRYFTISSSGTAAPGDFPLHFNLNGDSTRGTLVEGVVVLNSANRAFVPHESHGITFKDTIAKDVIGEAYWWNPGFETNDVLYDHVLADGVDYPRSLPGADLARYHRISAFFLGEGTGNVVRNSVARNTMGGADCSGFQWPEFDHGVWGFFNNAAYASECHGIFVWQNDSLPHVINGFTGGRVSHGAYVNNFKYFDLNVDGLILHALGRGEPIVFDGGDLGDVTTVTHALNFGDPVIFRNVRIRSFTVDNAGGEPGLYVLENTNLSCSDIVYQSVAPGTMVTIDGKTC